MAKPTQKTRSAPAPARKPATPQNLPAQRKGTDVSTDVDALLDQHSGKGISNRPEDNVVPLIYLLQPLSPQALKGQEKYIKGAEAGDLWKRNAPADSCIVKGEEGMLFQACHFNTCWIEWLPERGGFVARYDDRPDNASLEDVEGDDGTIRKVWKMPSGNVVGEYREYAGHVVNEDSGELEPYTISFTGSGHSVAKSWMTTMRAKRTGSGKQAPSFGTIYRLTSILRSRNNNNWYQIVVDEERSATADEIRAGIALFDAFESGAKRVENPDDVGGDVDATDM